MAFRLFIRDYVKDRYILSAPSYSGIIAQNSRIHQRTKFKESKLLILKYSQRIRLYLAAEGQKFIPIEPFICSNVEPEDITGYTRMKIISLFIANVVLTRKLADQLQALIAERLISSACYHNLNVSNK